MSLSSVERQLIKRLAEAYAFINDLRETGLRIGNALIVQRTEGIEKQVEKCKAEFPRLFQRYYSAALRRADEDRRSRLPPTPPPTSDKDDDGEGKEVQGRKKAQKKEKGTQQKATPRRRITKRKGTVKRVKPE